MCKIDHCEFQHGEHSAILIEGTQSLGKYMPLGLHFVDWTATHSHKNLTVEELYSHIVQQNLQKTFKVPDEEMTDCHLLIKDLKEKLSLSGSEKFVIPPEMSIPLAQRTSLPLRIGALTTLRNSTGCVVRECHFHSKRGAVHIRRQGSAWVEGCEISGVAYGIRCMGGSKIILLANTIHDCNTSGVFFRDRAGGLVAGNVIFQNGEAGVDIRNSSDPFLQHNQIFNGRRSGVVVLDSGRGMLVDNDIYDNREAGVYILYRGNPIVRLGYIH
jgi:parallel beta-helix repeat protein